MGKRRKLNICLIISAFFLSMMCTTPALAQWKETAKLVPSDGAAGDRFANSVGISGDTAVIGAMDDNGGSAYIFRFNGLSWVQEAKLLASDGAGGDRFGYAVAISGDTAVIGARFIDLSRDSGSAYVFRFNGSNWAQETKLLASDGEAGDYFGYSVAISGDTVLIGAKFSAGNGFGGGSAYVFRYDGSNWVEEAKLVPLDSEAHDEFGSSLAVSGDIAIIGAYRGDDSGTDSGAAYVFRFNGLSWVQEAKLLASDGAGGDFFGLTVSISGNAVVAGAPWDRDYGYSSGSAYIFRFDGSNWVEEAKLLPSDSASWDRFGWSAAISGDTVVIGACLDDDNGTDSGSTYIFRYDGSNWVEEAKLLASDGAADDWFANSVGISGDTAVIGAMADDDNGGDSGSAYVFARKKEFMITFDDGPIPGQTDSILLQLKNCKVNGEPVKAAFFMLGDNGPDYHRFLELWPNKGSVKQNHALVQIVAQNHLIGNHTQHHADFDFLTAKNVLWWLIYESTKNYVMAEISQCEWEIRNAIGKSPPFIFRPPYLVNNQGVRDGTGELGYEIIWGEVVDVLYSGLWWPFEPPLQLVKEYALDILKNWDNDEPRVLIFHDCLPITYNHIAEIISYLQEEGFTLTHFDPTRISIQKTEKSTPVLSGVAHSPVDLNIVDPDGLILNREVNLIPGSVYEEIDIDGDGSVDDFFIIPESKIGNYLIQLIPEAGAFPEDTYFLKVGCGEHFILLAENIPISGIPEQPYLIRLTEEGIEIIPATVRIEPEVINLGSKGKFIAFINLPDGYDVAAINVSSVVCEGAHVVEGEVSQEDSDTYIAKFNRLDLVNVPTGDVVTMRVRGKVLYSGYLVHFEGSDTIRVAY